MKKRLLCMLLALVLMVGMLPMRSNAASDGDQIRKQISRCYRQVLSITGLEKMGGYCATLVNWQLVLLGINKSQLACDGCDEYDMYRYMDMTSGGYKVTRYSARDYTMLEAIKAITENGTRDAYNIAMCFQATNTEAGQKYGHTFFIHAVIDGMVYFSESNDWSVGGTFYASGTPIVCTMEEMVSIYRGWTVFEGAVEFGLLPYVQRCENISTDINVRLTEDTTIYTQPCEEEVDKWCETVRDAKAGERFHVSDIYLNDLGQYWYRVDSDGIGYVYSGHTMLESVSYDNLTLSQSLSPVVMNPGSGYEVGGVVSSDGCGISMVRAQIYSGEPGKGVLLQNAMDQAENNRYVLDESTVSQGLAFQDLEEGTYHYTVSATAYCCYATGEELHRQWDVVTLWNSEFRVMRGADEKAFYTVTYETGDGQLQVNRTVAMKGTAGLKDFSPVRAGYRFTGWSLDPEGKQQVDNDTVFVVDGVTAYAQWELVTRGLNGWQYIDGAWRYYEEGIALTGWQEIDGIRYYMQPDGAVSTDWTFADGEVRCFRENGAVVQGWQEITGKRYYFDNYGAVVIDQSGSNWWSNFF